MLSDTNYSAGIHKFNYVYCYGSVQLEEFKFLPPYIPMYITGNIPLIYGRSRRE